ncbi:hypothetical protein DNU06_02180 [Putridiphycobacter roseus]|uniref:Uncharacterized protein n=1 Tax=Putridiphycobacter roseus TaxID=2219161 RepID=A0A2W1N1Z8_9FLAO|nr:hypothetical protein [Putridiphycobacter roseus]PZE18659.1 hypothetical protein DNU06_02180 [Putridiphycobacter roseus]
MEVKSTLLSCLLGVLIWGCNSPAKKGGAAEPIQKDSLQLVIEEKVLSIIEMQDSLTIVPSLRYSKGASETYAVRSYNHPIGVKLIVEEFFSNTEISQRLFYFESGHPIFIKESASIFHDSIEDYTERKIYLNEGELYKVFEKDKYLDVFMFDDTTFREGTINLNEYDYENALHALNQTDKYALHFDEFLSIEPQTYIILETVDSSMNVALFIQEGDSLLNLLYDNAEEYKGRAIKVSHYFEEMNGIERMIYNGAILE